MLDQLKKKGRQLANRCPMCGLWRRGRSYKSSAYLVQQGKRVKGIFICTVWCPMDFMGELEKR